MPTFSVVVPTRNRPKDLIRCLDSLQPSFQIDAPSYEVIVTNDGDLPLDPSMEATYPWVRFTNGPRRGPASNRNHGATYAEGEWLLFTDDDCIPDRGWLTAYQKAITEHRDSSAFEGSISPLGQLDRDLADCPVNENGGCFWSANICVKRDLFSAIGGFDEAFLLPAHEDQDLYLRVKEQTSVPFIPEANVKHPVRQTKLSKLLRDIDKRNVAWIHFVTKNAARCNYDTKSQILMGEFSAHARAGFSALRRKHFQRMVYHGVMICFGLPMQGLRLCVSPELNTPFKESA